MADLEETKKRQIVEILKRQKIKEIMARQGGVPLQKLGAEDVTPPSLRDELRGMVAAPGQLLAKGAIQAQEGNPAAGAANLASSVMQYAYTPFNIAMKGYEQIPYVGKPLSNIVGAIPRIVQKGVDVGESIIGAGTQFLPESVRNLGLSPDKAREAAEAWGNLNRTIAPMLLPEPMMKAAGLGATKVGTGVSNIAEHRQARTAAKIGSILNVGKNISEARRGGQFIVEEKLPVGKTGYEKGRFGVTEAKSQGAMEARARVDALSQTMNEKIIDPATTSGYIQEGKPIIEAATKIYDAAKEEFLPNRALLRRMDWEIKLLQTTIDKNNGVLTPRQMQDFKVKNNALLKELYEKRSKGSLTEKQAAREAVMLRANAELRGLLEDVHKDVAPINWTEGAGLDVAKALDSFYEMKLGRDPTLARGSGITSAAAGRASGMTLFGLTELATYTPFRVAYNKLLNKVYGKLQIGKTSEFISPGQIKPYESPAPSPTIIRGLLPPFIPRRPFPPEQTIKSSVDEFGRSTSPVGVAPFEMPAPREMGSGQPSPMSPTGGLPPIQQPPNLPVNLDIPKKGGNGAPKKYSGLDEFQYPALSQVGKGSIAPEWVLDKKTMKVELAGEYKDIDPYLLDLSNKPTWQELKQRGKGIASGKQGIDELAANFGWPDGETFRQNLIKDLENYRRGK